MANNYTDHPELRFELNHPLMKRIVELKERNFRDKEAYDYAPLDLKTRWIPTTAFWTS